MAEEVPMPSHWVLRGVLPAIAMLAVPADAAVTVAFVDPNFFSDAADSNGNSSRTLLEIKRHLERLGDRYLQPKDSLRIEVLNVDLAGQSEAGVSKSVQETVVDMTYLRRVSEPRYVSDPLQYEKRMLDNWFKARFGHQPPR